MSTEEIAGPTLQSTMPVVHGKRILWLAWKDYTHPAAGGAEVVLRELMQRQVADGNRVTLLTSQHPGSKQREMLDGIDIIRVGGNRYLHSFQALWFYLRKLRSRYDIVIETVNTAPYFSVLFKSRAKRVALAHQLAREIWHYETKAPLSHIGYYLLEPLSLRMMSRSKVPLVTVSESTRQDIARYGWHPERTHIISEGIEIEPTVSLEAAKKFRRPTMLSFGSMRGMKRTLDQIEAFELAKLQIPDLRLKIAGDSSGPYGAKVLQRIAASAHSQDIEYVGRVTRDEKITLMQRCHLIAVTSVKEGWGLIVTEAASQGTPAVVYDVDGLRDSVRDNETGIITATRPAALASGIVQMLKDPEHYEAMRQAGWHWSKAISFDTGYQQLTTILEAA